MKAISKLDQSEVEVKVVGNRYIVVDSEGNERNLAESSFKKQFKIVEEVEEEMIIATVDFKGVEIPKEGTSCKIDPSELEEVSVAATAVNSDIADSNETVEGKLEEETFEQWIGRTCDHVSDITIEQTTKGATKVRDSARVAFLENKKAYERTESQIQSLVNKPSNEEVLNEQDALTKDLTKYANRARKYYGRYIVAKEMLAGLKTTETLAATPEQVEQIVENYFAGGDGVVLPKNSTSEEIQTINDKISKQIDEARAKYDK